MRTQRQQRQQSQQGLPGTGSVNPNGTHTWRLQTQLRQRLLLLAAVWLLAAGVAGLGDVDALAIALAIALRNLIDNALKHGGASAQVVVDVSGRKLSVKDDGPGAPTQLLPRLVRPFERGAGHALQGSGLGLALVDTIARQSGATLTLQSPLAAGRGFGASLDFNLETSDRAEPA